MSNLDRNDQKALDSKHLAAAVAVAALLTAGAGIMAGQASGAYSAHAQKRSYHGHIEKFKRPKLRHGVLSVTGTNAAEKIALRLKAGDPGTLQIDLGDDGTADFEFDRSRISEIEVDARGGDDLIRIDDVNGAFTDAIPTTLDGGDGNDNLVGGQG